MRFMKRITERGTVTLPSDVREALGVAEGDIVEFEIVSVVRRRDGTPKVQGEPVAEDAPDAAAGGSDRRASPQ